jgi:hypothetical protein
MASLNFSSLIIDHRLVLAGERGAAVLVSGHDPCHRGRHAIAVAVILSSLAVLPESPAKKPEPEKYHLTGEPR